MRKTLGMRKTLAGGRRRRRSCGHKRRGSRKRSGGLGVGTLKRAAVPLTLFTLNNIMGKGKSRRRRHRSRRRR